MNTRTAAGATVSSRDPATVAISTRELPAHESDALARVLVRSVTEYFKLPGIAEEYRRWKEERAKAGTSSIKKAATI